MDNFEQYMSENDYEIVKRYMEKDNYGYINMVYKDQDSIIDYMIKKMKDEYKDDCIILNEKDIDIMEYANKKLGFSEFLDENIMFEGDEYDRLLDIWQKYMLLFCEKKIIMLTKIIKDISTMHYISGNNLVGFRIDGELDPKIMKAKVIVMNKDDIKLEYVESIKRDVNLLTNGEIYIKNSKIEVYEKELIEKTWHPKRYRNWCLALDDII